MFTVSQKYGACLLSQMYPKVAVEGLKTYDPLQKKDALPMENRGVGQRGGIAVDPKLP